MPLSNEQIASLLGMINTAEQDDIDCDGCFEHLAQFAETRLANQDIPDALRTVEIHLRQCACCKDEYNALLEGLRVLEGE